MLATALSMGAQEQESRLPEPRTINNYMMTGIHSLKDLGFPMQAGDKADSTIIIARINGQMQTVRFAGPELSPAALSLLRNSDLDLKIYVSCTIRDSLGRPQIYTQTFRRQS